MSYYPKPNSPSKNKIKVELALSSYAKKKKKKIWRKNAAGFETSKSAKNTGSAEVDKLDIDKSKTVPTDLSELCNWAMLLKRLYMMMNSLRNSILFMLLILGN